ncbi:plastocyanin [Alcanivorax sp. HI0033]|uniref:cupredoxin domain-containing protein n=3 Tax=Alcanivorax TaxID=59753 RepID=UPI0007B8EA11|nr:MULTISPECIES: cupredoxin domain-containing protein [unclassified Alcanivorax]KZX75829.1 plastocyanin [Alcanivorax sp. HI0013]KZX80290.1 plastocyanin [Alcanivorax sp. HI0011]KZY27893.1 plastocyanin [Alcanivorax sp. HI0035]MEE3387110.1 cupredoxin domain-containing protein [Pseudomonadota bacterium]KZX61349.1 plastocyanin [Alcanivorax sp. HI0003]
MTLLINLAGLLLMMGIVWWFWLSNSTGKSQAVSDQDTTIVVADGVYKPATLHARAGETLTLHFDRRDPSPCAEQVVFHGLDVSEFLETGSITTVTLNNPPAGEYRFTCQMQMYQGRLIVSPATAPRMKEET